MPAAHVHVLAAFLFVPAACHLSTGVRASAIHSLMPYDVLKSELARFRSGDLEVLFNVEVHAVLSLHHVFGY